jgi:hypothetical protein
VALAIWTGGPAAIFLDVDNSNFWNDYKICWSYYGP